MKAFFFSQVPRLRLKGTNKHNRVRAHRRGKFPASDSHTIGLASKLKIAAFMEAEPNVLLRVEYLGAPIEERSGGCGNGALRVSYVRPSRWIALSWYRS